MTNDKRIEKIWSKIGKIRKLLNNDIPDNLRELEFKNEDVLTEDNESYIKLREQLRYLDNNIDYILDLWHGVVTSIRETKEKPNE